MPRRFLGLLITATALGACMPSIAPTETTAQRKPETPMPAPEPSPTPPSTNGAFLAFGDSLTYQAFVNPATWPDAWRAEGQPGAPWPLVEAATPGLTTETAIGELPEALARAPGARIVSLALGTNDAYAGSSPEAFAARMESLIRQVRAHGATPMLPTIPYSTHPRLTNLPAFNRAIAAINAREGLAPGPDLYAAFEAHPEELQADQIHLTRSGAERVRRLWAAALQKAYGQTTTPPS